MSRSVQGLLAFLALHPERLCTRDRLAGTFWGELAQDRARASLNTTVWRLRKIVEPDEVPRGTFIETTPSGDIRWNAASGAWVDVAMFEQEVARALTRVPEHCSLSDVRRVEMALGLYVGDLMEGFFDDWVVDERERLRRTYLDVLTNLIRFYRHLGDTERSLSYAQRVLAMDPFREHVHRELMLIYEEAGERALAIRQYQLCREVLESELGVEPAAATKALVTRIASSSTDGGSPSTEAELTAGVLEQLRQLQRDFADTGRRLDQLSRLIERWGVPGGARKPRPGATGRLPGRAGTRRTLGRRAGADAADPERGD